MLVKNQTAASENGIWVCDTGPWRRSKDFSRTNDVVKGTQVAITDGTVSGGYIYSLMTDNPIVVGVTSIVFDVATSVAAAAAFAQEASDQADRAEAAANLALNNWGHIAGAGNGIITDIPLAANPGTVANTIVNFDGILQMKSTYVLVDILGVTNIRFIFNGLSDCAIYAPNGELFANDNLINSCAMLGGAAPLGGSLIRIGQGMCHLIGNIGRRALNSPGIAYVTGIQWDGATLATRKAADNDFFSYSGAAETGTK
ncbi:hypothetical protein NE852_03280 [Rhizobium sp. Pop5]|uniref:hypothetical protein n=1 Tax=Rhizobium sp. Pop5 TaxID=1223565 RepID=UPI000692472D|nr:hypothetical protein [Rhizobium sp. Pop5]UVD57248.1 hypothetical protein NE852_03280 [Rhizobium sp. Pop5]